MGEKRHPGLPVSLRGNASVSCAFACPACIVAEIHSVKEYSVKVSWHTTKEYGAIIHVCAVVCALPRPWYCAAIHVVRARVRLHESSDTCGPGVRVDAGTSIVV